MYVIKRNGTEVDFDKSKIINAITKANNEVSNSSKLSNETIINIANTIEMKCIQLDKTCTVEEIQDMVEDELFKNKAYKLCKCYMSYRYKKALERKSNTTDEQILSLIHLNNEEIKQENSNKNPTINSTQRDYIAGEISKDISKRLMLPKDVVEAHNEGILHFHDMDYFIQPMHNCCLVNLEDMLQNGTVISGTMIEKPHSFSTACNVATQIIAQVASSQYGGQTITLSHLAPFVDVSRQKIRKQLEDELNKLSFTRNNNIIDSLVEQRLKEEIKKGVQTIQYQVLTLMTTNGQTPFITVSMYLGEVENEQTKNDLALIIEEMLKQRMEGVKNEKGVYITPAFPKLVYVLEEDNINTDSKYWYLTELAAKCTAKRMVPDYVSEKIMKQLKINKFGTGDCYPPMGCRSFLTPYRTNDNLARAKNYDNTKPKYFGRFNQGVVTLNLVDVALSSNKDINQFWDILNDRLKLCYKALMCRHNKLLGTPSDVAPILWQNGALARLDKGEKIDKLLYDGYSTISLGYAGLYECVKYMTNESHTQDNGKKFGLEVMQKLNDACNEWKKNTNIDFSLYGTPLESTTYKFAKCLKNRFGIIDGITDKNYITNSYHIHVTENIDAFSKLTFESEFQKLSPGGAISYVEVPNMENNIPAVLALIKHIYNNILYAELNTKSDYCQCCGYTGEIKIEEDSNHKLIWKCPNCGNTDQNKMNVARRTCGYIGTQYWNQGRTQEIKDRVLHL